MTIELNKIPYVNGLSTNCHDRIEWIINGDLLVGAVHKFEDGGNLNRPGVQIQENVMVVDSNTRLLATGLDSATAEIEHIKEVINDASDLSLIEQVTEHTTQIDQINATIQDIQEKDDVLENGIKEINDKLGTKGENDGSNTIYQDIQAIKVNIGNKADFDLNGNELPGNPDSGIYKNINDVVLNSLENTKLIGELQTQLSDGNFDNLNDLITQIRFELGRDDDVPGTIYTRVADLEQLTDTLSNDFNGVSDRVGTLETTTSKQTEDISGIVSRVDTLEANGITDRTEIETATANILTLTESQDETDTTLESHKASIDSIIADIGDASTESSINGRIKKLQDSETAVESKVQEFDVKFTEYDTDVVPVVNKNSTAINGNSASTDAVEKAGLMASTKALYNGNIALTNAVNAIVSKYNYNGKTFSFISDKTVDSAKGIGAVIASKTNTTEANTIYGTAGIQSILDDNLLSDATKSDVIAINIGTYDYFFNTDIGEIADATDSYTGDASFYNLVYQLLSQLVSSDNDPRVFVTNGVVLPTYTGSDITYPGVNTSGAPFAAYSKAISDVAKTFGIPVLNTVDEMGISISNGTKFSAGTGLNAKGETRLLNYISGSVNSK